jgi:hypothetical protein
MKPAQFTSLVSFLVLAVVARAEYVAIQRDGLISFQPRSTGGPQQ